MKKQQQKRSTPPGLPTLVKTRPTDRPAKPTTAPHNPPPALSSKQHLWALGNIYTHLVNFLEQARPEEHYLLGEILWAWDDTAGGVRPGNHLKTVIAAYSQAADVTDNEAVSDRIMALVADGN